ncbi:MAG: outer membrane beta-barrel protein [Terracidiphilus sp.]
MNRNMNCLLQTMAGAVLTFAIMAGAQTPATPASVATPTVTTAPDTNDAILKELEQMKARIAQLEAELRAETKAREARDARDAERDANALRLAATGNKGATAAPTAQAQAAPAAPAPAEITAEITTKLAPFPGDWTWLNSNGRVVDTPLATKYFTPEIRFDANYILDYNHPKDDSMGGSTEMFRSDEWQLEQVSVGGDFRLQNVRGRLLTMFGMFATTTPRNDASYSRGQWNLANAYRYFSEAWGGYHWDVNHGLNVDAGIFVSYIGLFSYYNADNWAYQPSFVSSNTPWFFNGLRIQWYPTAKLKIEPWIINGWQSYARYNGKPGLGGQILYRPKPWLDFVWNNYGVGEDDAGYPGRSRVHADYSAQVKYYDKPKNFLDKAAFSLTGDIGCEYGGGPPVGHYNANGSSPEQGSSSTYTGGVNCHNNKNGKPKQSFVGWMAYTRFWFKKDLYAVTLGGGQMSNPGRYLTLLPPINNATATTGTPYFTMNGGDRAQMHDGTITFDYMPNQYITFRVEESYRYSDVPYWTGRGGITPPGGNNGNPANYQCATGGDSGYGYGNLSLAEISCGSTAGNLNALWWPDLRTNQTATTLAFMVRF